VRAPEIAFLGLAPEVVADRKRIRMYTQVTLREFAGIGMYVLPVSTRIEGISSL